MSLSIPFNYKLLFLVLIAIPVASNAQTINWKNNTTGSWFVPSNWWEGTVPGPGNNVGIENNGDAMISGSGFVGRAESVNVGVLNRGTLRIVAAGTLRNNMSYIGNVAGSSGHVEVNGAGSLWDASGTSPTTGGILAVGQGGNGLLEVTAGASVLAKYAKLGVEGTATGTASIGGAGSLLTLSKDLIVGENGRGTLNVHTAAKVNAGNIFLGYGIGTGTATVAGTDTQVSATRSIFVGYGWNGYLEVTAGAKLGTSTTVTEPEDSSLSLGHLGGTTGVVVVSGSGSAIEMRNSVLVGYQGTGTLSVADDGRVSAGNSSVGHLAGSHGTVSVTGVGSVWQNEGDVSVGREGRGTVYVADGGRINSATGNIGTVAGGTGEVYVNGAGSAWVLTGSLTVGAAGTGTLNISAMGHVESDSGHLGEDGGLGTVSVDGEGSRWTNTQGLSVGHSGTGQVNILNGGTVSGYSASLGTGTGGSGEINVLGGGSSLAVGTLTIGEVGRGKLNVTTGASVDTDSAVIGSEAGGHGEANITGEDSHWTVAELLTVGAGGTGQMNITLGAGVSTGRVSIGATSGGEGEINVANDGSSLAVTAGLLVGEAGKGVLGMMGGQVVSAEGIIGVQVGATGTASVFSGTWSTASLVVGDEGDGTLELTGNGLVRVNGGTGQVVLARTAGSTGTLNIGAGDTTGVLEAASVTGGGGMASVNFNHAGTFAFTPVLSGTLTVTKSGTGTTVFAQENTYEGVTRISDGTLMVSNTAGSATGSSDIEIDYLGTLTGGGSVDGDVLVEGHIAPGEGIGRLTTGSQDWGRNGTYLWEIGDVIGGGQEWDSLMINGDLSFSSLEDHPFTIALVTLTAEGAAGLLASFDEKLDYVWTIATVSGDILDWAVGQLVIDTSGFANAYSGAFSLVRNGQDLNLTYKYDAVPEPSTWLLLGWGLVVVLWVARRQRRGR